MPQTGFTKRGKIAADDLREAWPMLLEDERFEGFKALPRVQVEEFFSSLRPYEQMDILLRLPEMESRFWIRFLPSNVAADVIQEAPDDKKQMLLSLLDDRTQREVQSLLAYAEDDAGGLMSPDFIRLRPEMMVDQAITYVKKQTQDSIRSVYYLYVLDPEQRLLGVLPFRELITASPDKKIHEIMRTDLVTVQDTTDQEEVGLILKQRRFLAVPVVDVNGVMKGIVTADTVLRVAEEEATEDIQKMGGMEVLDDPYFETSIFMMLRKRVGWLVVLFCCELIAALTMDEKLFQKAAILTAFIPLIISSGGNSGSQTTTLIIRAMSLEQVKLKDWFRVLIREIASGLSLGLVLAMLGFIAIFAWPAKPLEYQNNFTLIGVTIGLTVMCIVIWGTLIGSMLPFIFKRLGFDPASASAPFVATIVDVTGLIIYFTMASYVLSGTLL